MILEKLSYPETLLPRTCNRRIPRADVSFRPKLGAALFAGVFLPLVYACSSDSSPGGTPATSGSGGAAVAGAEATAAGLSSTTGGLDPEGEAGTTASGSGGAPAAQAGMPSTAAGTATTTSGGTAAASGTSATGAAGSGGTETGGSPGNAGAAGDSNTGGDMAEGGGSEQGGSGAGGAAGTGGMPAAGGTGGTSPELSEQAAYCAAQLDTAAEQYDGFRQAYADPGQIPRSADNGSARLVSSSDWTSGFPAGSFWYLYEHTGDESWRTTAESWTAALSSQQNRTSDHDIGFIINTSFGNGYRLTGNADYASVLQSAAQSLSTRFNATVGAIRSWDFGDWQYPVIIDNMMNLELLFRATELGGSADFRDIAITHALTTLANHFRPDASSYHVVDYNPQNGDVIARQTNQGLSDESAWARGQAWGLYGYTMSYRETQDQRFLDQALAIADFYTQHPDMPDDGVPYFDFDAPSRNDVTNYRDVSAGAIAASALLELSGYASGDARDRYLAFALHAIESMSSPEYRAPLGENGHFLLMHAVGNYPINDEVDVAINYADYYYLEALTRCKGL